MKKLLLLSCCLMILLSSCATIFTSSRQTITVNAKDKTDIFYNGNKIARVRDNNTVSFKVKKKLSSKVLIAKKEGYKPCPIYLDATLNPVTLVNLIFPVGFFVDLATGTVCKWDDTYFTIDQVKADENDNREY